ncbi:hypothetical protein [Aeromicrobium sp. CTD01-1L150]|uniref:hypothetical protein n=1 Tax=Aeromicrobium sp. CTD01-1L150 TaxID=3341830 RepID=UPI0035C26553
MNAPQRWQKVAWRLGAHDVGLDFERDECESDPDFLEWAETAHGAEARRALAVEQALKDTAPPKAQR